MLLSLSKLPIYLLFIYIVSSADLNSNKRVLRRQTKFIRSYNFNHPPAVENFSQIPVTVVYDDEKVFNVRNNNGKKADSTSEDKTKYLKYAAIDEKTVNLETPSVNHPLPDDLMPFAVNDYEEGFNLKPKARSIKVPVFDELEGSKVTETESNSVNKTRRRTQQVRKMKTDKSLLEVYVDAQGTEKKVAENESTRTDQTSVNKPSIPIPKTFERRKKPRDPVVPIIESENYVFSHSGNFHYSYEGGDGTKAYERGELKTFEGGAGSAVEGNYSYKDKDGNDYSLSYTADENGYRPVGAHLPTPPPIPPAIQRALDFLATKTTPESITERIQTNKRKQLY